MAEGKLEQRLAEFATMKPNWDSYGADPPTEAAMATVSGMTITPTNEGGIEVSFLHEAASVEIAANGQIKAVGYWRADDKPPKPGVPTMDLVEREQ